MQWIQHMTSWSTLWIYISDCQCCSIIESARIYNTFDMNRISTQLWGITFLVQCRKIICKCLQGLTGANQLLKKDLEQAKRKTGRFPRRKSLCRSYIHFVWHRPFLRALLIQNHSSRDTLSEAFAVKGAVSWNSAKFGNYKMPVKLRET